MKVSLHLNVKKIKTSIFLMTIYFEFEWLFINEIEVMIALYY
jgi:hypothetical protein